MAVFDFEEARRSFERVFGARGDGEAEPGLSELFAPVDPFNRSPILSPVIALVGAGAVFALAGVATVSFFVTGLCLLAVWFLLSEVFGYELELPPMPR